MNAKIHFEQGLNKVARAAYGAAIQDFNEAERADLNTLDLYYHRGFAHYKLGEYQAALNDFEVLMQQSVKQPSDQTNRLMLLTYLHRGLCYHHLGDYRAAIANFSAVLEIDTQYAVSYQERGLSYLALSDSESARQDLGTAAQLFRKQGNQAAHQIIKNLIETLF